MQPIPMETIGPLRIRRHGNAGPRVIVLHGGPGAAGSAEALARGLAGTFTVIEPWQRGSGGKVPLTVAQHVADLYGVVQAVGDDPPPALVGESWGAMLALAYAAQHPRGAGALVLVGCGSFDAPSRLLGERIRKARINRYLADHPEHADDRKLKTSDRIIKWHEVTDNYDKIPTPSPGKSEPFDMQAFKETWEDMLRCQEAGLYPGAFGAIDGPVLMLHGSFDPHPGKMIRDCLKAHIPQLEYREFEKCGHTPAVERWARDPFFKVMKGWLLEKSVLIGPTDQEPAGTE